MKNTKNSIQAKWWFRIIVAIMAIAAVFVLSGCQDEGGDERGDKHKTDISETKAPEIETPVISGSETEAHEEESPVESSGKVISFDGYTAIDNEDCTIMVKSIDPDNFWGYTLKVYFENKSSDKTYMFSVNSAAINGVECDPFFAVEVAAGKKANEEISFDSNKLKEYGIKDVTDIELTISVNNSDDWEADDIALITFNVYPYGESAATKYVRKAKNTDTVVVDNSYVTVIMTGYEFDDIWGYTANMYIVNKTDKTIMVSVEDASVNGYMLDPFFADSVSPGRSKYTSMSWFEEDFAENDITEVEEIEFILKVNDYYDWLAEDFVSEKIVLNP